jgi:hypothetical protein
MPVPFPLPPGRRPVGPLVAVVVAVVAVLVSVVSMLVAWRALDQASDARDIAVAAGGGASTGPGTTAGAPGSGAPAATSNEASPADPGATTGTDPSSTGEPPPLNENTVYTVKYESQPLIFRLTSSCTSMGADLDDPRVNVSSGDVELEGACSSTGPPVLTLGDGAQGSQSGAAGMTPQDCYERIRYDPIAGDAKVPVRKGTVVCVMTSRQAAITQGIPQRMVRLQITGVGSDGAVTIEATAWNIPG